MKVSYFGRKMEQSGSSSKKSTELKEIRRIILDRYAVLSYLDKFEDHCLTLKNAPHVLISCAAYETLVNEEDLTYLLQIRRITFLTYDASISRLHQRLSKILKDMHCIEIQVTPHLKTVYKYSRI